MELKLVELTHKTAVCHTYEIYKHCMYMPTEEKFSRKADQFLNDDTTKFFACFNQNVIEGVIVASFIEQQKIEIVGIAVVQSARGQGIGSFMINQVIKEYCLQFIYAETDQDAVGFYRKNGFIVTEYTETYHDETVIRYQCKWEPPS